MDGRNTEELCLRVLFYVLYLNVYIDHMAGIVKLYSMNIIQNEGARINNNKDKQDIGIAGI